MLAMHYRFKLKDQDAVAQVRRRVLERGPMFDGFPGMGHKWFLIDPADPCYAVFYLWDDAAGAVSFLDGEFFANLSATFGRPEVRLLLARSVALPQDEPAEAYIAEGNALGAAVQAFDPRGGTGLSFGFGPGPGRRFELAYHARGGVLVPRHAKAA